MNDRLFIVTYDITDPKRWRRVFRTMEGYGEWLQLSVFQCRLSARKRVELEVKLRDAIKQGEDHVLLIDLGPAERIAPRVTSLGKAFKEVQREVVVI